MTKSPIHERLRHAALLHSGDVPLYALLIEAAAAVPRPYPMNPEARGTEAILRAHNRAIAARTAAYDTYKAARDAVLPEDNK